MTKILITVDRRGDLDVYSDCPNVEVIIQDTYDSFDNELRFQDGVYVEDFAATQHKVW